MSKRIVVMVSGPRRCGKTSLALAFKAFLEEKGFTRVSVSDADVAVTGIPAIEPTLGRRMESIKETHVVIDTWLDEGT